jgi:hypothetical protein
VKAKTLPNAEAKSFSIPRLMAVQLYSFGLKTVNDGTVWFSQKEMAQLYRVSVSAISKLPRAIFAEGELDANSVIND